MRLAIASFPFILLALLGNAADEKTRPTSEKVAASYFEALMGGNVEMADSLAAAPFYFDGKGILKTLGEIKEKHRGILEQKGQRKVPAYTAKVLKNERLLDSAVFPAHQVVGIDIEGEEDRLLVYVTKGETPKVIGFRD